MLPMTSTGHKILMFGLTSEFLKELLMTRALVLLAAFVFFRTFLVHRKRSSPTETSPYMNSLDGLLSAQQLSAAIDELSQFERQASRNRSSG
jgi:hypothetical protein